MHSRQRREIPCLTVTCRIADADEAARIWGKSSVVEKTGNALIAGKRIGGKQRDQDGSLKHLAPAAGGSVPFLPLLFRA